MAARGTQALPVVRFICRCARSSSGSTALACRPCGYFASSLPIACSLSAAKEKVAGSATSAPFASAIVLPVDLAEYDVDRSDDRHRVRQHVTLRHRLDRLQMREAGGPDLAAIRTVGAI